MIPFVGGSAAEEPGHHFSQFIKSKTGMQSRLLQHHPPTWEFTHTNPCGRLQHSFRRHVINTHGSGTSYPLIQYSKVKS